VRPEDNPIQRFGTEQLKDYIKGLFEVEFKGKYSATFEELWIGAQLAGS
jgi:hypothetical protein